MVVNYHHQSPYQTPQELEHKMVKLAAATGAVVQGGIRVIWPGLSTKVKEYGM
jgi:hypothetical protein